ncbi:hypothetical protein GCM10027155_15650 [Acinetobacter apis]
MWCDSSHLKLSINYLLLLLSFKKIYSILMKQRHHVQKKVILDLKKSGGTPFIEVSHVISE